MLRTKTIHPQSQCKILNCNLNPLPFMNLILVIVALRAFFMFIGLTLEPSGIFIFTGPYATHYV